MFPIPRILLSSVAGCLVLGWAGCGSAPERREPEPLPREATETQRDLMKRIDVLFVAGGGDELDEVLAQASTDPDS